MRLGLLENANEGGGDFGPVARHLELRIRFSQFGQLSQFRLSNVAITNVSAPNGRFGDRAVLETQYSFRKTMPPRSVRKGILSSTAHLLLVPLGQLEHIIGPALGQLL